MKHINRRMSDKHEEDLLGWFGGRRTPGSGNGFANQMDVRQSQMHQGEFALAIDGKSTLGKSISVTREMWQKAIEQSHAEEPMLALRFYASESLKVDIDLAVVDVQYLRALQVAAGVMEA